MASAPLTQGDIDDLDAKERPYRVSDGGGLHLLVKPNGSKLWRLAYRFPKGTSSTCAYGVRRTASGYASMTDSAAGVAREMPASANAFPSVVEPVR